MQILIDNWQSIVTAAIVLCAVCYLLLRARRLLRGRSSNGCGTCASCPAGASPKPTIVALDVGLKSHRSEN